MKNEVKQRLTSFVDPILVKRAKIRGALEGLTISQLVEKALEAYTPTIEKGADQNIHVKILNSPALENLVSAMRVNPAKIVPKHTKTLVVPR